MSNTAQKAIHLNWLDLRASGLSILERLSLEEALLRHDHRNWAIVGCHEHWRHKYLTNLPVPSYIPSRETPNDQCMIVMGIGGKPANLLNRERIENDNVVVSSKKKERSVKPVYVRFNISQV